MPCNSPAPEPPWPVNSLLLHFWKKGLGLASGVDGQPWQTSMFSSIYGKYLKIPLSAHWNIKYFSTLLHSFNSFFLCISMCHKSDSNGCREQLCIQRFKTDIWAPGLSIIELSVSPLSLILSCSWSKRKDLCINPKKKTSDCNLTRLLHSVHGLWRRNIGGVNFDVLWFMHRFFLLASRKRRTNNKIALAT